MKAWRLKAQEINERRRAGSKEPTARVQKEHRLAHPTLKGTGNWLLAGLLIRAGEDTPNDTLFRNAPQPFLMGDFLRCIQRSWSNTIAAASTARSVNL